MDITDVTAANRAAWDASAPLHCQGADWEALLHGFSRPGFSVLDQTLTETLEALAPHQSGHEGIARLAGAFPDAFGVLLGQPAMVDHGARQAG